MQGLLGLLVLFCFQGPGWASTLLASKQGAPQDQLRWSPETGLFEVCRGSQCQTLSASIEFTQLPEFFSYFQRQLTEVVSDPLLTITKNPVVGGKRQVQYALARAVDLAAMIGGLAGYMRWTQKGGSRFHDISITVGLLAGVAAVAVMVASVVKSKSEPDRQAATELLNSLTRLNLQNPEPVELRPSTYRFLTFGLAKALRQYAKERALKQELLILL